MFQSDVNRMYQKSAHDADCHTLGLNFCLLLQTLFYASDQKLLKNPVALKTLN